MIYRSDWDAADINFVFALPKSIDGEIAKVSANDYLIWFQVGDCIYRLYRPTNTLDFVYGNPDMLWWRPVSNYSVEYAVYSEEYLKAKQDGREPDSMSFYNMEARYQYNALAGKAFLEYQESPDSEWQLTSITASENVCRYASYNTAIAGKGISKNSCPIGCFVSPNGQKCTFHTICNNDNCNISGSCGCLNLGNINGLETGPQYMGFTAFADIPFLFKKKFVAQ